jgi:hypothetical protein
MVITKSSNLIPLRSGSHSTGANSLSMKCCSAKAKRLFVTAIIAALLYVRHNVVHASLALSNQKEKS